MAPAPFPRPDSSTPIVIVSGLPRSGTSLMMSMLEAGGFPVATDRARAPDEDNPRGYFELERVKALDKAADKAWLGDYRGKALKVVTFLLRHLPDDLSYKVILMSRSLEEVVDSQDRMLERRGERSGADRSRTIRNFEDHLGRVRALLAARPNVDWIEVDYGRAVQDPFSVARQVADFLGEGLDARRMATVADPALYRNRR